MNKLLVIATVSVSVFAFVIISLSTRSFAIVANPSVTPKGNAIVQELKEKRCNRITEFIDKRIQTYDENKTKHIENHQKIVSKITTLMNSLNGKGFDTTQLQNDLNTLNQMVNSFAIKYNQFINTLRTAKTLGCGDSEEDFKQMMEQSRTELKFARDEAQAIWKFINTTIRKDLNDLKVQKLNVSPTITPSIVEN